jgi:hypothetical protein
MVKFVCPPDVVVVTVSHSGMVDVDPHHPPVRAVFRPPFFTLKAEKLLIFVLPGLW